MARKAHSPPPALPKVSYTKVDDNASTQPAGVHDLQARSYGYNDFSHFQRPDHYIRHIEPLESELAVQVEYDMDEQDQEWLDAVNAERKHDQLNKVTYEVFEIIMDKLEKEWFDLTKNIPKPDLALPLEDSTCAICDDAEGENSNAIVFCDGCNLAVHQDCYGVPYIPEGQWLCRKCTVSPEIPVSCALCPNEGGAFKQTVNGEWVHLLCAIWVPETRVANDVFMEPIVGVEKISKQRWKLKCSICDVKMGACIQCSKASCFLAFHATCARRDKLLLPMKSVHGSEPATLTCFCEKHLPKEQYEVHEAAIRELAATDPANSSFESSESRANVTNTPRSAKKARAYAKSYSLTSAPPLIPALIVGRILSYIGKVAIRKKQEFVHMVCRYWSLKREARRGAPLLKRLHLEPWSGVGGNRGSIGRAPGEPGGESEEVIAQKLEYIVGLRKDLERVRLLAELTYKRENKKLKQAEILQDTMNAFFFSHTPLLRLALEQIEMMDRHEIFKNPVSKTEVPDYFDIIKKPMCWKYIDEKLDKNEYFHLKDFQDDINLVLDNAMLYNRADTSIYRTASRIKAQAVRHLEELEQSCPRNPLPATANGPTDPSTLDPSSQRSTPISPEQRLVGDLEAPLEVLDLLLSNDAVQEDYDYILSSHPDPLASLFAFEFGDPKPPPPPSPPVSKPKAKSKNPKRDRKAEKERRLARLEAQKALDNGPGFRAPTPTSLRLGSGALTRSARAAAEAFEAEIFTVDEAGPSSKPLSTASDSPNKPSSKRWKRPIVLPGQTEVPPVVDDVDSHRSFTMFDEGWILPPGHRRGGRAPIERVDRPPPRKRPRMGEKERQQSTLSIYSTPASENQTLVENISASSALPAPESHGLANHQQHAQDVETKQELTDEVVLRTNLMQVEQDTGEQISGPSGGVDITDIDADADADGETDDEANAHAISADHDAFDVADADADADREADKEEVSANIDSDAAAINVDEVKEGKSPVPEPVSKRSRADRPQPIIIEELDTPATRRAKSMAKKQRRLDAIAEQQRLAAIEQQNQAASSSEIVASSSKVSSKRRGRGRPKGSGKGKGKAVQDVEMKSEPDSELSELSSIMEVIEAKRSKGSEASQVSEGANDEIADVEEVVDEDMRSWRRVSAVNALKLAKSMDKGPGELYLHDNEFLEGGTLVWAKVESYPWWPAVIYEEDDVAVPQSLLDMKDRLPSVNGAMLLVQFWDAKRQWQWLPLNRLKLLGEVKELDAAMLAGSGGKGQRFKNNKLRDQCRQAYRAAMAEMEGYTADEEGS